MGGDIRTCRIAKMARYKRSASRHKAAVSFKWEMISSPPASPFNSTAFLIRQRSQQQKEAGLPPILGASHELDQYGSNSKDVIACCTFDKTAHEQGCGYKSQADHPVIVGLSPRSLARNQGQFHATDPPQPERNVTHHRHSDHGGSSAGARNLEDLASVALAKGLEILEHRRTRSVTDDNFDIFLENVATSAKSLQEMVDEDLRDNFCALEISAALPA